MEKPKVIRESVVLRDGKMQAGDRDRVAALLRDLPTGRYDLTLRPAGQKRSLAQNSSWWKFRVEPLADYLGWERDEMHEFLKTKFLGTIVFVELKDGTVEEQVIPGSTASLSVERFTQLFDEVARWAVQELGFVCPDPDSR